MTLPKGISKATCARHGDDTLRLIFPLGNWKLEQVAGSAGELMLTLQTLDGLRLHSLWISTRLGKYHRQPGRRWPQLSCSYSVWLAPESSQLERRRRPPAHKPETRRQQVPLDPL
jgi:hypothetical protein